MSLTPAYRTKIKHPKVGGKKKEDIDDIVKKDRALLPRAFAHLVNFSKTIIFEFSFSLPCIERLFQDNARFSSTFSIFYSFRLLFQVKWSYRGKTTRAGDKKYPASAHLHKTFKMQSVLFLFRTYIENAYKFFSPVYLRACVCYSLIFFFFK